MASSPNDASPLPGVTEAETDEPITPAELAGEIRDFTRAHERQRRLFPRAALLGLLVGLLAVAFRVCLDGADAGRNALIRWAHLHPTGGWIAPIVFSAVGAAVGVFLVQRFAPEASGSGIPHLKLVLHRLRGMKWRRILPVKFVGAIFSIGAGLVMGREGPTIQMGGATGQMLSRFFKSNPREQQTLIAAGAGAGLSAAFNAPLSGVIFVLEEIQRDFTPTVFIATFVACVIADVVARLLGGQLPAFHTAVLPIPPLQSLPVFLVLGGLCGVLGVAFNRALLGTLRLYARIAHWPRGAAAGIVGAIIGTVGWFAPQVLGGGHGLVEETLAGRTAINALVLFFVVRFALTMLSYGTGAAGGFFAPLLVLGAQFGLFVGLTAGRFFPHAAPEATMFAVVGMAAYFTAIVRAPLTGIVLIIEMTGNYSLMLPLLVACFCAYTVADLLGDKPIYEALVERDLLRGQGDVPHLESNLLLELPVFHGAHWENKRVAELGLPVGALIVTVERGMDSLVATRDTVLEAGDRITVVISPEAAPAAALIRENTSAPH